jgi:hypothetical protein
MNKLNNEYIIGSLKVALITKKFKGNRLMRREKILVTRRVDMNVKWWRERGRPKKRWIDYVTQDMREMAVNEEMTSDRGEWRKRTFCADPKWTGGRAGSRRLSRKWTAHYNQISLNAIPFSIYNTIGTRFASQNQIRN